MKVKELEKGMLLTTCGDNQIFTLFDNPRAHPYITVRTKSKWTVNRGIALKFVMYVGDRKSVGVSIKDCSWSNRYVVFNNVIAAVDPSAWNKMRPIE